MTSSEFFWSIIVSLFLVPLSLFLVSFWMNRLYKTHDAAREKSDGQIAFLLKEREDTKDKLNSERREQSANILDEIKSKVNEIASTLNDKVDWTHCGETEKELREAIEKISDRTRR